MLSVELEEWAHQSWRNWTKGGALRNLPIDGGSWKNSKRNSPNSSSSANPSKYPSTTAPSTIIEPEHEDSMFLPPLNPEHQMLDISGSFSSLPASSSQLGSLMEFNHQPGDDLGLSLESH
ncbi:hypothetical protein J5N97_029847 [Dioscorea zingiberensis]|uniref:Uncharacterized protein n=1 Tax=Dioscorea zingiberensis TaxID=325984 RepID=A0A9D5BWH9_9LILI|nr:hypothetical protein J5N97_029847 [Dioscorea zingiberensis]